MEKKYKLREDLTKEFYGKTLYRIEALRDFGDVEKGELGGYIEKEENLIHDGNAEVCGDAVVYGNAEVRDDAEVCGDAVVYGNAKVYGDAKVCGNAQVCGDAVVYGNAQVWGNAKVWDNAKVCGNAQVCGDAKVWDNAKVYGDAVICGDAVVCGKAQVYGDAVICGDAVITKTSDYYVGKNTWSSGRYFTYTRSNRKWKVGCFYGTGEELIEKAYKDSEVSGREYKRIVEYVEAMYNDLENDKAQNI